MDEALELWLGLESVLGRMCSALPHTLTCLKWTRLKRYVVSFPWYSNVKNGTHTNVQNLYQGKGRQKEHC